MSCKALLRLKRKMGSFNIVKIGAVIKEFFACKLPKSVYKGLEKIGVIKLLKKIRNIKSYK